MRLPTTRAALPILVGLFGFFTPFSIAGAHISLSLAVALLLLDGETRGHAIGFFRSHPLRWPVAGWILVTVAAVVFAVDPAESAPKLKKLALLTLLPLGALPIVRKKLRFVLGLTIASAAFVSLWGLVVHLAQGGGLEARLRGVGGFYMTVAGILMIVGLLCVSQLLSASKDPHLRRVLFLGASTLLVVGALLATYTRGSWVGFAVGMVLLLRKRWAILLGVVIVGAVVVLLGPPTGRDRVLSIVDPDHPRNAERVLIWKHGLDLVAERPWTGVGLVIPGDLMEKEVETEHGVIRVHSHMHNAYLQIAVSMGIPALLVFLWLMYGFLRAGIRAPRGGIQNLWEEGLVGAYVPIVAALLANGMFEWNFGDSEVLGLFYFVSGCMLGVESGGDS